MVEHGHGDNLVAVCQPDTPHARGGAAVEAADVRDGEADGLAHGRGQQDIVVFRAEAHIDDAVTLVRLHRNLAVAVDAREVGEAVAANTAGAGRKHDVERLPLLLVLGQRHDGGDAFVRVEARDELRKGAPARRRAAARQLPDLELVGHARAGKQQDGRVGRGDEDGGDEILVLGAHTGASLAAARLRPVGVEGGALDVAGVGHGHDHVLDRDQVLVVEIEPAVHEDGAARRGELLAHLGELVADDRAHAVARAQNGEQVGDGFGQFLGLVRQLLHAERGQAR